MSDIDPIRARVVIEYDGSGLEQAKEDLASLAAVASDFGQAVSPVGDVLSGMADTVVASTHVTQDFGSSLSALGAPFHSSFTALSQWSDALSAHQDILSAVQPALLGMVSSVQAIGTPLVAATRQFVEASAPMFAISEQAQSISEQMSGLGDGFAQIQEPVGQSIIMLPQYADSLHTVGLNAAASQENMAVFQDALVNPEPFSVIQSHLDETGQSWSDFTSSIGESNTSIVDRLTTVSDATHQALGGMAGDFTASGKAFTENSDAFQAAWDETVAMRAAINPQGGVFGSYGPALPPVAALGPVEGPALAPEFLGVESVGMGEAFGGAFSAIGDGLSSIMMPMMAVQMITQMVGQLGTGIYNAAAVAEGPAAHSFGSFTGTVDALGQSAQKSFSQFSEGFGQGLMPVLNVVNSQAGQGSSGIGGLGQVLGGIGSFLVNLDEIGGLDPIGGMKGFANQFAQLTGQPEPFQGPPPLSPLQQAFATMPQTVQAATTQLQVQSATTLAEALDPNYLAAQDNLSASNRLAQRLQASYNASHPISDAQLLDNYRQQQYDQQQDQIMASLPHTVGDAISQKLGQGDWGGAGQILGQGWNASPLGSFFDIGAMFKVPAFQKLGQGDFGGALQAFSQDLTSNPAVSFLDSVGGWFHNLFGGGQPPVTEGCFIAGTRVLIADGSERAIETLRVGEQVQSHAGPATVLACIVPPPKQVYTLTFADGSMLTLTDSHPIASPLQGWKSLSPESTKRENPELSVTKLEVGDSIVTRDGTTTLVSIHPCKVEQVYNITVGGSHTFYANGVLVHNKVSFQSSQDAGFQLPHFDLSGITSSLANDFSNIHLPHLDLSGITSNLSSAFSSIHLPSLSDIGSSISSELGNVFSGIHLPSISSVAGSIGSELGSLFSDIHLPSLSNLTGQLGGELGNLFSGIHLPAMPDFAGQLGSELGNLFSGIHLPKMPDIVDSISSELGGLFSGIQIPKPPDIAGSINSALSSMFSGIHMPGLGSFGIPGFAGGVENFTGGPAFIAESGPELVMLPSGASVYPLSVGAGVGGGSITPISLSSGSGGNNGGSSGSGGSSGPLHIHLNINGRELVNIIGPDIASEIRGALGLR